MTRINIMVLAPTIALILFLSPTHVANAFDILDSDGDPVKNGFTYYILPNKPSAKPLGFSSSTWPTTTPYLIRESDNNFKPTPVTLAILPRLEHIASQFPIFVAFVGEYRWCKGPLQWFATSDNWNDVRAFATVCGQNGELSRIKIDHVKGSSENAYTMSFCANGCADKLPLGWVNLGGGDFPDWFSLGYNSTNPLPVVFVKESKINPSIM